MSNFINQTARVSYDISAEEFEAIVAKKKQEGRQEALAELATMNAVDNATITRKEAMLKLGISESTIISWAKRGLIRVIRRGHKCLYFQSDIDRIIKYGTDSIQHTVKDMYN